jgi:hypothetical protein
MSRCHRRCGGLAILATGDEIVGTEGLRQDLTQGCDPLRGHDERVITTVFEEQLPASPTWHQGLAMLIDTGNGYQPATPGGMEAGDQSALGAQSDPVGGVLDIATGDDAPIIDNGSYSDLEPRIRRIGMVHHRNRRIPQRIPVHLIT